MRKFVRERPWIWIVGFFLLFLTALSHFVVVCVRNAPKSVPLQTQQK